MNASTPDREVLVLLAPVLPARLGAAESIDEVLPAARLDPWLEHSGSRRAAVRLGQGHRSFRGDEEVDSALVELLDLIGGNEPAPSRRPDDEAVEDVLLRSGDDVIDVGDLLPVGGKHGHALVEHQIRDWSPLVHSPTISTGSSPSRCRRPSQIGLTPPAHPGWRAYGCWPDRERRRG